MADGGQMNPYVSSMEEMQMNRTTYSISIRNSANAILIALATLALASTAEAWNTINIPGDWDGWNQADNTKPWLLNKVSPPGTPNGVDWYTNVVNVAASGGDTTTGTHQFKMVGDQNWANQWSGATVTIDGTSTLTWNSGNGTITFGSAGFYSFRAVNPPSGSSAKIAVMKTSARPVTITLTSQTPVAPRTNDTVAIGISLSASKSSEEHVYVRWTSNNWTSSSFPEATGSGTSYTATIPAMPNGRTVDYYGLTSTSTNLSSSNADALTLNLDSNGGSNYGYTSRAMPWPGGDGAGYPSDPASRIHHWKEEAVVGNNFMTVQIDQNGALYDIYFPSAGDRHGISPANEGYRGPEEFPSCGSLDAEANGQMNVIAGMGGIGAQEGPTNSIYWLQNESGTAYVNVGQQWVSDWANVVSTTNKLTANSNNIQVKQYDFCPSTNALPVVTDGTRTNYGVYIKRFLLTNNLGTTNTIDFYYDVNFNINGGNTNDAMYWETSVGGTNFYTMVAYDNTSRTVPVQGSSCDPNGYTTEYSPSFAFAWAKTESIYFGLAMKVVTNTSTGWGLVADGSWRDSTSTDNQEGWVGKRISIPPGATNEVDVMIVGSWDDTAGQTGTHNFWGRPLVRWFYTNSMATAQSTTETYWSNWLSGGVTIDFPDDTYDRLFKRSLLLTALHIDSGGAIYAGMHNGAYPFVWPRDGVYAAITLDRTGHTKEGGEFYKWLLDVAFRDSDCVTGGKGFFYQKYTTDGYKVWTSPQMDESASVPWGIYYHYLTIGDTAFLTNYWDLAHQAASAANESSCSNGVAFFDNTFSLMNGNNVWEDSNGLHIYSNASIVRGLRDAAFIADYMGDTTAASGLRSRANTIVTGINARIDARVEPSDISHLGLVVPYEVYTPADARMTNMIEWISGRQTAGTCGSCSGGPYTDNLVENDAANYPDIVGLVNRYEHNINGNTDNYWNTASGAYKHSPWFLATSWYGEYYTRWQDYLGGKNLVNTNKYTLDLLINKMDNLLIGAEQIAPKTSLQKYSGFWLQTAWPNVWESSSTMVDQMMMFLDYKPAGTNNNTCYFAPKLPSAWTTLTFNNMYSQGQRFNITISETNSSTRADVYKLTSGSLNYDMYLRIPTNTTPSSVVTNSVTYTPAGSDYDTATGRVHIQGAFTTASGSNSVVVNY